MSNIDYPFISCRCITYGRIQFLEEAVNSFLLQEYPGKKELIIVNDYPLQNIKYDHPEIKIYNLDTIFNTIGEKENFTIDKCSADIIALWDDDDIEMPNHLINIAKYFKEDSDLLQWHRGVYMNAPEIVDITGLGNAGMVYSKKIYDQLGGYPLENAGYDMTFILNIKANSDKVVYAAPPNDEVSFFYVWGGRDYHMSGLGTDTLDRPNVIERHTKYIEEKRLKGEIPTGDITLQPHWKYDYKQILTDFNNK
jgi:hypothetical protein